MPQFDINSYYSQIFWLVVVFGFLYIIVYKFVSPTAAKILQDRHDVIEDNLANSDRLAKLAKTLQEEYDSELSNILTTIETMRKTVLHELESSFALKKIELQNQLKIQLRNNLTDINKITQSFWHTEKDACIALSLTVIEKITNQKADLALLDECYMALQQ